MYNYTTKYKSKVYYPGVKYTSTYSGVFEILGRDLLKKNHYVVKFLDTGTIKSFSTSSVGQRCIRDPYAKTILGIACLGEGKHLTKKNGKMTKEYTTWSDMLRRCYGSSIEDCYKNTIVSDRWLNFQNFCDDIVEIPGYLLWKTNNRYALDKDKLQVGVANKVYSKDTCMFITCGENSSIANKGRDYGRLKG